MLFWVLLILLATLIYIKVLKPHTYWKEKGVRYVKPWPFFGNMAANILQFKAFAYVLQNVYNTFPEQRYFGCYQFLSPSLLIRDPDLIKRIMVKEFDVFPEHRPMIDADSDPLWSKNLFAMKGGEEWRDMRSTLSPAFTSSKMRNMFVLMKQTAAQFTTHFVNRGGKITLEMKEATTRFANDVIATTVFGVTCDSLKNPHNDFYLMTKQITDFKVTALLKFFGYTISPTLMKFFKFRLFDENVGAFYRNIIKETIAVREANQINRPDMIYLLMEARKGRLNHEDRHELPDSGFAVVEESEIGKTQKRRKTEITDEDITAQVLLFFFAGFETVSVAMSHLVYELALNPDVQRKLREEIDATREEDDVTYEALLKMKYLDMVVSETLRKWPPVIVNDRISVKPFTIDPEKVWEKTLNLNAGTICLFPIFAIHRDKKYYPEPDKFDPERFNDENKNKIKPFTYLPFGAGPRNCIGSRFALLEIKTFIFYLLSEFEIVQVEKTQNPLILSKRNFNLVPDKGFWVGLTPRHKKTA